MIIPEFFTILLPLVVVMVALIFIIKWVTE